MKTILTTVLLMVVFCTNAQFHKNPFSFTPDENEKITYQNPIIPGFYSDPSVCRVGEDYYLITSTFEYFPGVPVFHSKDLVNWEQIGHCIHRKEQLPNGINIFASTIRYNNGIYYMITTNTGKEGNFYVTATNPAGPWSDPIWLKDIPGIDPDLFFDDDGKVYVISSPFILFEIDIKTGKTIGESKQVYHGDGGRWAEGPHIYKKDGWYYLMAAEGGTEEAHSETMARSNSIWGPYVVNPSNPILGHANAAGQYSQIQGLGHADIVQAHDDSWWIVFHGYRKVIGYPVHHILGRETCVAPVTWPKYGWPVVNGNGTVTVDMRCPTLPLKPLEKPEIRDDFNDEEFGLEWNFIQVNGDKNVELEDGKLVLKTSPLEIGDNGSPAYMGRRLQHHDFIAQTKIDFKPKKDNEEAGIALVNNGQHFDFVLAKRGKKRVVLAKLQFGNIVHESKSFELKPGDVELKVEGKGNEWTFSYKQEGDFIVVDSVEPRYLSTETVGWFTGVYVGMYATSQGDDSKTVAKFDYFDYEGR